MISCFNLVISFSFLVQHLVHPATSDFCSRWGFFLFPSLATCTKSTSLLSHPIHTNCFSLGFSYAGAFAQAAPFLQSQSPLSPAPDKFLSFPVPPPPLKDLPFPAVLQFSLPAPSLLAASFPFHLLPIPACPLHLPSPHLRWDPAGRWWQQAPHHPTSHLLWPRQCGMSLVVAHWAGMTPSG